MRRGAGSETQAPGVAHPAPPRVLLGGENSIYPLLGEQRVGREAQPGWAGGGGAEGLVVGVASAGWAPPGQEEGCG